MLPNRVYLPQELEALSSHTPVKTGERRLAPNGGRTEAGPAAGPAAGGGLRAVLAGLSRLVGRVGLRRPAPGTI
jgi:hypothetical protein